MMEKFYWNKNNKYRNVFYMNLLFIGYIIWGTYDFVVEHSWWGWYALMWFMIIFFNIERYLHYKSYVGEL